MNVATTPMLRRDSATCHRPIKSVTDVAMSTRKASSSKPWKPDSGDEVVELLNESKLQAAVVVADWKMFDSEQVIP